MEIGNGTFLQGDCLELMAGLPDASVDMVLCDPPYGTVKGMALDGWSNQRTEWDDVIDTNALFLEYHRILRPNGACILFAQEPYSSNLATSAINNLPFSYRMIWKKDHFANALLAKKAPVSYYEDILVFHNRFEDKSGHPLCDYFISELELSGKTSKEICNHLGTSHASHFFTRGKQFRVPNESYLRKMNELTGRFSMSYSEVSETHRNHVQSFRDKNPSIFNLPEGQKYLSNVLEFKKDYEGRHPTQKPVALFEYLIRTYTNPGEVVLDNTAGSGTTAIAAENSGRKWICMERDPDYYASALGRVWDHVNAA